MNLKEKTFSELENVLSSMLESASNIFESKKEDFKKVIFPKITTMNVYEKDSKNSKKIKLYRDVMFREEYEFDNARVIKESGIILTSDFELAKLEIIHLNCNDKENEKAYLSEIELSDIPMLSLFLESLEIDLAK